MVSTMVASRLEMNVSMAPPASAVGVGIRLSACHPGYRKLSGRRGRLILAAIASPPKGAKEGWSTPLSRARSGLVEPDLVKVDFEHGMHAEILHRGHRVAIEVAPVRLDDDARIL